MFVGQFVVGQLDLADEILRHFAEVPHAVCVFAQNRVAPRDYCVQQRHFNFSLSTLKECGEHLEMLRVKAGG